jgi:hypothetical protein
LLDGATDVDPAVQRLLMVSRVCEGFSCLPGQAKRELDNDPERLALQILDVRGYMAAKQAFDHAKDKVDELRAWEGSAHMTLVETHTFELRQARLAEQSDG